MHPFQIINKNAATRRSAILYVSRRLVGSSSRTRHAPMTATTNTHVVDFNEIAATTTDIDFENNRPFHKKKLKELVRSLTILKLCSYDGVVNNAERVSH